ncbi:SDR family NAD(P)-dependent oxidoreductase [Paenibacillus sp. SYP-B4298]|uniref:SDR family NAD(P)-dependent oxidoreductase n=1 Tax=Paenibacillus sp. SYP-B4298 TaxID=2996034 RepID=UPI0022DE3099|nr:SDR family NAD(P)-dependent oxidoreductase [Paenibacillus sp. SYP-B4298]
MNGNNIALITGASSGIGLALTRRLLSEKWQVVGLNRSAFPVDDPILQIAAREQRLREYRADLADFQQLRQALELILAQESHLDLIFNNAGGSLPEIRYSPQGRELHYELQTVAPYLIMMELKELLRRGEHRKVINTSTNAFATLRQFHVLELERPASFRKLFGPYAATKLAMSLWTQEAGPQLFDQEGITLLSVDPGGNNTMNSKNRGGLPFFLRPVMKLLFPDPSTGAGLLYEAALSTHNLVPSGAYLTKGAPATLKFAELGAEVLARVDDIYRQEY